MLKNENYWKVRGDRKFDQSYFYYKKINFSVSKFVSKIRIISIYIYWFF